MGWNFEAKILLQGVNESQALPYLEAIKSYGTKKTIVGVASEYVGESYHDIPIFDLVSEAYEDSQGIATTIIFCSPNQVLDAALEAINAGIKQIIINTKDIPPLDLFELTKKAQKEKVFILGTNGAGILIPEEISYGVLHPQFYPSGNVGIINYGNSNISLELVFTLKENKQGLSLLANLGDSNFKNVDWIYLLSTFNNHSKTENIILNINNLLYLDYEKLATIILEVVKKPITINLLDPDNLREVMNYNHPRIITDQIPLYLNQVKSPQFIIEYWQNKGLEVTSYHS